MPRFPADAAHCRSIVATHARTFALASWFLPPEKRRATYALYAFCRVADDLVDEAAAPGQAAPALAQLGARLDDALAGNAADPVLREVARAAAQYGVPRRLLVELLQGVGRDLEPQRLASWGELHRYCQGVASSVGEMCVHVFGLAAGSGAQEAVRYARALGVAMQLTNILRDVGEDARRGRCYLPDDELASYGLAREEILAGAVDARDPRWTRFAGFQAHRAREWYQCSLPGIAMLAPDAQRCALACLLGYARILGAIERNGWDSFTQRASLRPLERAEVLWQVAVLPRREIRGWHRALEPRWAPARARLGMVRS